MYANGADQINMQEYSATPARFFDDLLPSGLYRRPWILTKSVPTPSSAWGVAGYVLRRTSPPVGNCTLPRRSLFI